MKNLYRSVGDLNYFRRSFFYDPNIAPGRDIAIARSRSITLCQTKLIVIRSIKFGEVHPKVESRGIKRCHVHVEIEIASAIKEIGPISKVEITISIGIGIGIRIGIRIGIGIDIGIGIGIGIAVRIRFRVLGRLRLIRFSIAAGLRRLLGLSGQVGWGGC